MCGALEATGRALYLLRGAVEGKPAAEEEAAAPEPTAAPLAAVAVAAAVAASGTYARPGAWLDELEEAAEDIRKAASRARGENTSRSHVPGGSVFTEETQRERSETCAAQRVSRVASAGTLLGYR